MSTSRVLALDKSIADAAKALEEDAARALKEKDVDRNYACGIDSMVHQKPQTHY